jgi:hypothetical protein
VGLATVTGDLSAQKAGKAVARSKTTAIKFGRVFFISYLPAGILTREGPAGSGKEEAWAHWEPKRVHDLSWRKMKKARLNEPGLSFRIVVTSKGAALRVFR